MRFIARPRQFVEDGVQLFNTQPFVTLRVLLNSYGNTRDIAFMRAISIEVPDEGVPGFLRAMAETQIPVRRACAIHAIPEPPEPAVKVPASLRALALQPLWNDSISGKDVNVGVIDEAFRVTDCLKRAVKTRHFYESATRTFIAGDAPNTTDQQQAHGTFAAALIAGEPVDNTRIAVAPDANLHLVALPGVTFEDDLTLAIEFLVLQRRCRVVSISLGTWEPHNQLDDAVLAAKRSSALVVAAIGNSGKGVAMWPGACESALSVGYCDDLGSLNTDSGSTHFERAHNAVVPLVVAPGVMLNSSSLQAGVIARKSGSSFSTPLVAGLAALLVSDRPCATAFDVEEAILASCPQMPAFPERCARGIPNAKDALDYLRTITAC